jgi:hypothetical protein
MSTKRVLLTGALLLFGTALIAEAVSRLLFAPWSIGAFGRDTMTGDWVARPRARQGAEYKLFLELRYRRRQSSSSRSYRTDNLEGRATLCTPVGKRYDYAVAGFARPSGVIEDLRFRYADPKLSALDLRLTGAWRPPVLSLRTDANPCEPDGSFMPARPSGGDDPDDPIAPFDLTRGRLDDLGSCRPSSR